MHRVGGACARSSIHSLRRNPSFGELSGRESLARTELRRLHALVARFAEARSPQVEACAGRRLLNTSKLQIIPCKVAGNFRYNTVIFSVCQLRVAAYRWVAIPLLRAESRKVWEGGSKGRRARDATVRSGAFVAGADRAGRRRWRRLLRASAFEGAYTKRLCILDIGSWRRRFLCSSSARAAAPRQLNKVGRALSSHSARDDCSKRDDGRPQYPFISCLRMFSNEKKLTTRKHALP